MQCEECNEKPATSWLFDEAVCKDCADELLRLDQTTVP